MFRGIRFVIGMLMFVQSITAFSEVRVLAIGNNRSFDKSLEPLEYASDDSERFTEAMRGAGMVEASRITLLKGGTLANFYQQASDLVALSKSSVKKFIFYFSGHADERGLHFEDGLLPKKDLHDFLQKLGARIKIVILDSCYSGAIAFKGVRHLEAFEVPKMEFDEPSGSVFLTASSSRDVAIESDVIKGSIFTNNLIAGLYGEADGNADGVVTATELYEYSFRETRMQSFAFPVKQVQAPEFSSDLQGKGAVSISFPAITNGSVLLDEQLKGQVAIAHKQGLQFFQVFKQPGKHKLLRLPAGEYRVTIKNAQTIGLSRLRVAANQLVAMNHSNFGWNTASSHTLPMTTKGRADEALLTPRTSRFGFVLGGFIDRKRKEVGPSIGLTLRTGGLPVGSNTRFKSKFLLSYGGSPSELQITRSIFGTELEFYDALRVGAGLGAQFVNVDGRSDYIPVAAASTGINISHSLGLQYNFFLPLRNSKTINPRYARGSDFGVAYQF